MKILFAAVAAVISVGCATTLPPASGSMVERQVAFTCAGNESLSVRFIPMREVAILIRDGERIELKQQPTSSGFIYSNGPNTIRGLGDQLTVEIGRMMPIQCTAR